MTINLSMEEKLGLVTKYVNKALASLKNDLAYLEDTEIQYDLMLSISANVLFFLAQRLSEEGRLKILEIITIHMHALPKDFKE